MKNKYQEALQNLYDMRSKLIDVSSKNTQWANNIKIYDFIGDQLRTLQELVDKYSLKYCNYKEVKYANGVSYVKPFCPSCNKQLSYYGKQIRFCENCGQKIKVEE